MFNKSINQCSSLMHKTQWEFHRERLISFEPFESPCSFVSSSSKTPDQSRICFQQAVHQMEDFPPLCFEFPKTIDPQILVCQSSRDKFSSYSAEQECDGSSSLFRNSLHSVAESFLCSEDNFSSSTERYSQLPYWDHMPFYEQCSQEDVMLLGDAAADECRPPSIPCGRIQVLIDIF